MAQSKPSKALSGGCLTLLGLPFLAAGLFMSWLYFSGYVEGWKAQRWEEVPCWIESTELQTKSGDDSTTYKATATYRYEYAGQAYHGDQVTFGSGSDNVGKFQQEVYRELSSYQSEKSEKPFRCYVNPQKPSEAVLYRTLRWQLQAFYAIFALTFPAAGAGLVFGSLVGMRTLKKEASLSEKHPDQPWKWKTRWADTAIPESATASSKALTAYTLWAALIILPLIVTTAVSGVFQKEGMSWLLLIFVVLWCIPAWSTLKRLRHRMAVGVTRFELQDSPASPGSSLRGHILLSKSLPLRSAAEVSLTCEKRTTRSTGDGDSTQTENVWSHQEIVPQDRMIRDFSSFRLPVSFLLPADAPESGLSSTPSVTHFWKLSLKVAGTPIHSDFEVPVFRTATSPMSQTKSVPSILDSTSSDLPVNLAEFRINAVFDSAGMPRSIARPRASQRSFIVFLIIFNLIWTAAAVFLIKQQAPLMFRLIWPISASVIWLTIFWQLLYARSVTFSSTGLKLLHQLGPLSRIELIEKSQILGFSHDTNMSSNNVSFYRVRLESASGKKKTVADGIPSSTTAEALVKRLDEWKKSG